MVERVKDAGDKSKGDTHRAIARDLFLYFIADGGRACDFTYIGGEDEVFSKGSSRSRNRA